jgi:hypothetical protein
MGDAPKATAPSRLFPHEYPDNKKKSRYRNGIVKMLRGDFGQIAPFFIVNLIAQCDNFPMTKIY